jgi:hypothetical protein
VTIVEDARVITGGVDTHTGLPVAAALDRIGGLLGVREFPATAASRHTLMLLTEWLFIPGVVGLRRSPDRRGSLRIWRRRGQGVQASADSGSRDHN